MRIFRSIDIAGSGLTANRLWMDTISGNLANVNTTRTPEGGPYTRRVPVFQERMMEAEGAGEMSGRLAEGWFGFHAASGVRVVDIGTDATPPRLAYQPDHPDANADGYVAYPNVNVVREMADMMIASRAYEANLAVVDTAKTVWNGALDIMK
ncbi:MAG: flagellar basal body rod protein FlgC [Synergistaceae bacterium]|jgi:flagellar basal-body rod protein FlgC|nr:flagellar basal body rod protein FlgC [Synergistaceae bacterium]